MTYIQTIVSITMITSKSERVIVMTSPPLGAWPNIRSKLRFPNRPRLACVILYHFRKICNFLCFLICLLTLSNSFSIMYLIKKQAVWRFWPDSKINFKLKNKPHRAKGGLFFCVLVFTGDIYNRLSEVMHYQKFGCQKTKPLKRI